MSRSDPSKSEAVDRRSEETGDRLAVSDNRHPRLSRLPAWSLPVRDRHIGWYEVGEQVNHVRGKVSVEVKLANEQHFGKRPAGDTRWK